MGGSLGSMASRTTTEAIQALTSRMSCMSFCRTRIWRILFRLITSQCFHHLLRQVCRHRSRRQCLIARLQRTRYLGLPFPALPRLMRKSITLTLKRLGRCLRTTRGSRSTSLSSCRDLTNQVHPTATASSNSSKRTRCSQSQAPVFRKAELLGRRRRLCVEIGFGDMAGTRLLVRHLYCSILYGTVIPVIQYRDQ